ncbi:ferrochelatase [Tessaracoccus defluvii]|uniref:ferrochelatase n=1 Tax=Tessaracoccus defluvii TaxID=1285901 RepID=UPI0031D9F65D
MSLAPYTAVMLASYGGPDRSEDVLPFMRNATVGRGIPDERLVEVSQHYELFGGRSPINELNAALLERVAGELTRRGIDVPVVIGNRNWHPFFAETAARLADDGHERVAALATSAYSSYSSCRQYREDLDLAESGIDGRVRFDKVGAFAESPKFVRAQARAVVAAWRELRSRVGADAPLRLLFVTHSIPLAMNAASGPGAPDARYDAQHLRVAAAVADLATQELGEAPAWELTYCSRSGSPHVPWLEPDVNDRMAEFAGSVAGVVTAPIGFISDHMEVLYDLDTQARQTAADEGLAYQRAATVDSDPEFVELLVDRLVELASVARGEATPPAPACGRAGGACCLPRPTDN